jgi:hypothetical protein
MLPHRLPRPLRLALYALASAILLVLTLAPQDELPQAGLGDKWQHAVAWFVLTLTGLALAPRRPRAIALYALASRGSSRSCRRPWGSAGTGTGATWRPTPWGWRRRSRWPGRCGAS